MFSPVLSSPECHFKQTSEVGLNITRRDETGQHLCLFRREVLSSFRLDDDLQVQVDFKESCHAVC